MRAFRFFVMRSINPVSHHGFDAVEDAPLRVDMALHWPQGGWVGGSLVSACHSVWAAIPCAELHSERTFRDHKKFGHRVHLRAACVNVLQRGQEERSSSLGRFAALCGRQKHGVQAQN